MALSSPPVDFRDNFIISSPAQSRSGLVFKSVSNIVINININLMFAPFMFFVALLFSPQSFADTIFSSHASDGDCGFRWESQSVLDWTECLSVFVLRRLPVGETPCVSS